MRKASSDQSCVVPHEIRNKTSCFAQSLRFGETSVRLPEPRLGPLSIFNVCVYPVPLGDLALLSRKGLARNRNHR